MEVQNLGKDKRMEVAYRLAGQQKRTFEDFVKKRQASDFHHGEGKKGLADQRELQGGIKVAAR